MMNWLFAPLAKGRIAALRTLAYAWVIFDPLVYSAWIRNRGSVPTTLYQPLLIARVLHLPQPTASLVHWVFWSLLLAAAGALVTRGHPVFAWAVCGLYLEWLIIGMSYGKVDHDRFAFLVALAVLPTVGRARHGDQTPSQRAGWALRCVQLAVIATYFLSSWAKLRYGGPGWATGSVLARAFLRKGSGLADLLATLPPVMIGSQIGIMAFELLSPLVFLLPPRWRYAAIGFFYSFHAMSFALISISFGPHLIALASFLPLENAGRLLRRLRRRPGESDREGPAARDKATAGSELAAVAELAGQRGYLMDSGNLPILVYDGDCGFCTRAVTLLSRRLPAFPDAEPWQRLNLTALGLTEPQVRDAVQWVGPDGTHCSGARVASALLRYQPSRALRALGALCDTAAVRPVLAVLYRWVAAHRHQLPGGTAMCRLEDHRPEPTVGV